MTTIAVKDGVMACDTQITGGHKDFAKSKIRKGKGCVVGFCGDWFAGEALMNYYITEGAKDLVVNDDDDVELLILNKSGIYLADKHFRKVKIRGRHYAIGSGSPAAMVAMNMGATAVEAIREAAKVDDYTGGKVKSITL